LCNFGSPLEVEATVGSRLMSAAGSLVGRKRDRLAHSPAPKGLSGAKGTGKALERLAAAHTACTQLLANQAYPEPLSELALAFQHIFGAKLVVLSDSAFPGVAAVAPAKTDTTRWLESLAQHHLEGREPTTRAFDLDANDSRPPIAGVRRFVVVPLSTGRGRGALWLGFGDHAPTADELLCLSVLGEHLSLALRHATAKPPTNGTHTSPPNGKLQTSSVKPVHAQTANELISLAAHELRTPLTPITMLLQSLERKARTGATDLETILRARKQVARLTTMISDLLDLSRLREDRLVLSPVRVDLVKATREAVQTFQETDSRHRIDLRDDNALIEIVTDERRLQQMLCSLLDHVAHATPAGGTLEVTLERRDASASVTIRSDRPTFGVDTARAPDIAPPIHPRPEPVALGVLLAEGIAKRFGGSLSRVPNRGSETRVEATFPLSTPD
jgi:hypothetical protein